MSPSPPAITACLQVNSTLVESPESQENPEIPSDYTAFQDVFSKQAATKLPPHRPRDCAIDLLPGTRPPKGRVYPLSIPERKAMENYIKEALQQGFIRPSTSPAASSFFFVGKKDGGLRPCIDYRALNANTVKLPYPLPLVPAALEELRGARIFSKLDLRIAYTSFESGKATSGRRHSSPLLATTIIGLCRMASPTHRRLPGVHERGCSGTDLSSYT